MRYQLTVLRLEENKDYESKLKEVRSFRGEYTGEIQKEISTQILMCELSEDEWEMVKKQVIAVTA